MSTYRRFLAGLQKTQLEADCDEWRVGVNPYTGRVYSDTKRGDRDFRRMRGKCDPCAEFEGNPRVNPRTGRPISPKRNIYKQLVQECGAPRHSRSRSRSRSRRRSRSSSRSPRRRRASSVRRRRSDRRSPGGKARSRSRSRR